MEQAKPQGKIIGYNLNEEGKKYEQLAKKLADITEWAEEKDYSFKTTIRGQLESIYKEAGVLDLWFDPVYKIGLEVGDFCKHSSSNRRIFLITVIREEYADLIEISDGKFHKGIYLKNLSLYEPDKSLDLTIAGHKPAKWEDKGIEFGCQKFTLENLRLLHKIVSGSDVIRGELTIRGNVVTEEIIKNLIILAYS